MVRPPYGTSLVGDDWSRVDQEPPPTPVSVVVLHYEQHDELARTLHALGRQTLPADLLEVVVVDDGSTRAPDVPAGVRLVRRRDTGFTAAAARNEGVAATRHPLLVLLDADTTPEPGFVEAITRLPALLPEAVCVGRRRHADLRGSDPTAPVERLGPAHELPEPAWLREGYLATRDLSRADSGSYRYVISSVLACSRWLLDEIGGFDEGFEAYGGEDWELAWRAWQHGGLLAHRPDAVAWHDGPDWAGRGPGREADRVREAKAQETLRVARRVAAPTASLRGLLLGPAELLVTLGEALTTSELVITVDSLLAAVPHATVAATPRQHAVLGDDPRVVRRAPHHDQPPSPALASYALLLHLAAGAHGAPAAWQELLGRGRGAGHPQTLVLRDTDGEVGRLEVLRAHRRAARWERDDLFPRADLDLTGGPGTLRRLDDRATLEAHVGGWL